MKPLLLILAGMASLSINTARAHTGSGVLLKCKMTLESFYTPPHLKTKVELHPLDFETETLRQLKNSGIFEDLTSTLRRQTAENRSPRTAPPDSSSKKKTTRAQPPLEESFNLKLALQWLEYELQSRHEIPFLQSLFSGEKKDNKTPLTLSIHPKSLAEKHDQSQQKKNSNPLSFSLDAPSKNRSLELIWEALLMIYRAEVAHPKSFLFPFKPRDSKSQILRNLARWDYTLYRSLEFLQSLDPHFDPISQIDSGSKLRSLNFILGDSATFRHEVNKVEQRLLKENSNNIEDLYQSLNNNYCAPLVFREGIRCGFRGLALYFLLTSTTELLMHSEHWLKTSKDIAIEAHSLQNLSQSEEQINRRFQLYLQPQQRAN